MSTRRSWLGVLGKPEPHGAKGGKAWLLATHLQTDLVGSYMPDVQKVVAFNKMLHLFYDVKPL